MQHLPHALHTSTPVFRDHRVWLRLAGSQRPYWQRGFRLPGNRLLPALRLDAYFALVGAAQTGLLRPQLLTRHGRLLTMNYRCKGDIALISLVRAHHGLPPPITAALLYQLSNLVRLLHARGLAHGCLHPSSMVIRAGRVHLMDGGIFGPKGLPFAWHQQLWHSGRAYFPVLPDSGARAMGQADLYMLGRALEFMAFGRAGPARHGCLADRLNQQAGLMAPSGRPRMAGPLADIRDRCLTGGYASARQLAAACRGTRFYLERQPWEAALFRRIMAVTRQMIIQPQAYGEKGMEG